MQIEEGVIHRGRMKKRPQRDMTIYAKGLGLVLKQRPFKFLDRMS